jgi:hypothetical protein
MSGAIPPLPQYTFMAWCLVEKKAERREILAGIAQRYSAGLWAG